MRRVEAANHSLTVAAPSLVSEFPATFDTNLMMHVPALIAGDENPVRKIRPARP